MDDEEVVSGGGRPGGRILDRGEQEEDLGHAGGG